MKHTNETDDDPKSLHVIKILRQIERLNIMIEDHSRHTEDDALRVEQYELLRADFLAELRAMLSDYGIEADLRVAE